MGRRNKDRRPAGPQDDSEFERTLAAAEADAQDFAEPAEEATRAEAASDTRCACGNAEFVLEALLHVVDGKAKAEPLEVESLTCPECGREFEAIATGDGRFLRGDFLGYVDLDE